MEDACGNCGKPRAFTEPVAVVLVFAPGLARPYPLIPSEDYRVCGACDSIFIFIDRATDSHPATRRAGRWTRAVVLFIDGHGVDIKAKRAAIATA